MADCKLIIATVNVYFPVFHSLIIFAPFIYIPPILGFRLLVPPAFFDTTLFYSPRSLTSASIGALQSESIICRLRTLVTVSLTTE